MSEGVTFERRWNGCNDLVVLQKINLDVIFITEFLWGLIITLIVQQILHKQDIFITLRLPKHRFVFNVETIPFDKQCKNLLQKNYHLRSKIKPFFANTDFICDVQKEGVSWR